MLKINPWTYESTHLTGEKKKRKPFMKKNFYEVNYK